LGELGLLEDGVNDFVGTRVGVLVGIFVGTIVGLAVGVVVVAWSPLPLLELSDIAVLATRYIIGNPYISLTKV